MSHSACSIPPAEHVPLLTELVPASDVPPALGVAWDARMAEKKALMDLSNELIQNLRPELDRLTSELVRRTLEGLWAKRCEKYQISDH
jgi:hypothetical protein